LGSDDDSQSSDTTPSPAQREPPPVQRAHRRTPIVSSHRSRSTADVNADAMGLARQLAGSQQEQLQQATNREVRQADDAREREAHQGDEARKAQEEALKVQEAAYNMELERARQTDRREDRLFDQFRDSMDRTRTDLTEAALLRERAARLELGLKYAREAATEVAPPTVTKYFVHTSEAATGTQPPIRRKLAKKMRHFFRVDNRRNRRWVLLQLLLVLRLILLRVCCECCNFYSATAHPAHCKCGTAY